MRRVLRTVRYSLVAFAVVLVWLSTLAFTLWAAESAGVPAGFAIVVLIAHSGASRFVLERGSRGISALATSRSAVAVGVDQMATVSADGGGASRRPSAVDALVSSAYEVLQEPREVAQEVEDVEFDPRREDHGTHGHYHRGYGQ